MTTGEKTKVAITVTGDTLIENVINRSPEARSILERHFGNGCFTCPGIRVESLAFGAMMHNVDASKLVNEINAAEEKNEG